MEKAKKSTTFDKSGHKTHQKPSRLDKTLKGFLVKAMLVKDGNQKDTMTSGGDIVKDS